MKQNIASGTQGINKNFPGVKIPENVDLTLRKDEIHVPMRKDSIGESMLIKALAGVKKFEAGTIQTDSSSGMITNRPPQEAQGSGISAVYREVNLCPNLSVAENLYIGRELKVRPLVNWKTMRRNAQTLLESLDVRIDVSTTVENYSIVIQQMIVIARAVDMSAKVLILDEPISSLDDGEMERLFMLMRQLQDKGIGTIFIAYFLEQVCVVCNGTTVLRNGALAEEYKIEDLPRVQLMAKVMGEDLDDLAAIKKEGIPTVKGEVVINAKGLDHKGATKSFNLDIRKGEVIGLTGLLGSGRFELVRATYGADKPDSGELLVKGWKLKVGTPIDTMMHGMAYPPENCKEKGIVTDLSMRKNIIIAFQVKRGTFELMSREEQEEFTGQYIGILQIKTAGRETPIKRLSRDNQQKMILDRWLPTQLGFLILDEPTKGIDIGTKTEMQKLALKPAEDGMSVVFISSKIEKMPRICSRMAVMRDGEEIGELVEGELSQDSIMEVIAGGGEE